MKKTFKILSNEIDTDMTCKIRTVTTHKRENKN